MKVFLAPCAGLALLLFSVAGQATTIKANYTVTANTSDPGLKISTTELADNPFQFDLAVHESKKLSLFWISADESTINADDLSDKTISVSFGFLLPDVFDAEIDGNTHGAGDYWEFDVFGRIFADGYNDQRGELRWDEGGAHDFAFGPNGDGLLSISLSAPEFNACYFSLCGSSDWFGAPVEATFTLVRDATTAVPEPGALALFGLGLLGLGFTIRRQRSRG